MFRKCASKMVAHCLAGLGIAFGILLGAGAEPGWAKTWTVTVQGDQVGWHGTLRWWLERVNDSDVIVFSSRVNVVELSRGELVINKNITLVGPMTIIQRDYGRVFNIAFGKTVSLENLTLSRGNTPGNGGGIFNAGTLTMKGCTVTESTTAIPGPGSGGGIWNEGTLTMENCVVMGNACAVNGGGVASKGGLTLTNCVFSRNRIVTSAEDGSGYGGGVHIAADDSTKPLTATNCTFSGNQAALDGGGLCVEGYCDPKLTGCAFSENEARRGGGILTRSKFVLALKDSSVSGNSATEGGGIHIARDSSCSLSGCTIRNNRQDEINGDYTSDGTNIIGNTPNKSATAFSGYAGETEPAPRSIVGDADVAAVKTALANPQSGLYAVIEQALAADLGKTVPEKSASLAGMSATLYDANTFEDVSLTSTDLSVEYTASWPENVRYYALFARADNSGYELADRGVQFEIKAGQSLPEGVTPPDFYVPGEGLMTWRNVVTDGGPYDLNPAVGVVTIRVCSVRAAEATGDKGSGGGCDAGAGSGFAPTTMLLLVPVSLYAFRRRKVS
jgi:predicted outer membrane repeat protein